MGKPKVAREAVGLVFPAGKDGDRSTMATNKACVVEALRAVDPQAADDMQASASSWRFAYEKGFQTMFCASLRSPDAALAVAEAGLAYLHGNFEFIDPVSKQTSTLAEAMRTPVPADRQFSTAVVEGTAPLPPAEFEVPYKGKMLRGTALADQIDTWVKRGTIEDSAGRALRSVIANQTSWLDLRDKYFVLLGAGSAMGPIATLLSRGANVVAVDLNRPTIWKRLIAMAKNSPGRLIFPISQPRQLCTDETLPDYAGCNLFTDTPRIAHWLHGVEPSESLIIGSYAYLDGALHVQVALAMDAIVQELIPIRGPEKVIPAYLHTPTDLHVIPESARTMSKRNYARPRSLLRFVVDRLVIALTRGKWLAKNTPPPVLMQDGQEIFYVNSLSKLQGPNYALAKRLQQWRAILARSRDGCVVSANVAPATYTASNLHVRAVGWALKGMSYFDAMEVFPQETTNTIMTAILLYDIGDKTGAANPQVKLRNPLEMNAFGAVHGGTFRSAYKFGTMGQMAGVAYFARQLRPLILLAIFMALLLYVVRVEFV